MAAVTTGNEMLNPDEALARVVSSARRAAPVALPVGEALGLVLAEKVPADRDAPPFDRAMMDGFAVVAADAGRTVQLVGEVAAGATWPHALEAGTAVRIMTGARVPAGADAVVPVEQASAEGEALPVPAAVTPEQHIARHGSETPAGASVVRPGWLVTPLVAATLAGVGRAKVRVIPRPRLAILATGNELEAEGAAAIRDTNSPMLEALARCMGVTEIVRRRVADTPEALREALAACEGANNVLLTGGVSAGRFDLVPAALAEWGAQTLFHKVSQMPGKPLLVAQRGAQLVFGLPGNPLAALVGFQRYVAAALRVHMGLPAEPQRVRALLTADVPGDRWRTKFALLRVHAKALAWQAEPVRLRGSADLYGATPANAMVRVESGETLAAGNEVQAEWLVGAGAGLASNPAAT